MMRPTRVGKTLGVLLLALLSLLAAGAAAAGDFSRIVAFGDSLSDPGNAFVLLRDVSRPPFELIPDAPYGLHFSNGETWVEQFAAGLHLRLSAGPALLLPRLLSNYAVGGARARPEGPFHLTVQVGRFLSDFRRKALSEALYVVHIGGNDIRDALEAAATDPSLVTSLGILGQAITAARENITMLAEHGAHTFLVPNAPDFSLIPAVRLAGPAAQAVGQFLSGQFNGMLDHLLDDVEDTLPVTVLRLNVSALFDEVVDAPARFGLSNVEGFCICEEPDEFLFRDGIHPTRAAHAILARRARAVVSQP